MPTPKPCVQEFDPDVERAVQRILKMPARELEAALEMENFPRSTSNWEYCLSMLRSRLGVDARCVAAMQTGFYAPIDLPLANRFHLTCSDLATQLSGGGDIDRPGFAIEEHFAVRIERCDGATATG